MSTLNVTKSVQRSDLLFSYVQNSFPTLVDLSNNNTILRFTFSDNQTANLSALQSLLGNYVDPLLNKVDQTSSLSVFNSTSNALGANASFTGSFEDISVYATVRVMITASNTSGTLNVQTGVLSKQPETVRTYPFTGGSLNIIVARAGRYLRIAYTNGAVAQTSFSLATYLTVTDVGPVANLADAVTDKTDVINTRAVTTARYGAQQYGVLRLSENNELRTTIPATYQRLNTGVCFPVFQNNYTYNLNTDQNTTAVIASGSVTWNTGRVLVSSGAVANSSGTLSTYRYARCASGDCITVLFSCVFSPGVAGNTQIAGAGYINNGVYVGYNGTSFGVMLRNAGVDSWTPQSSFNTDTVDGNGKSGMVIVPTTGNDYCIQYDAMGYGAVIFSMLTPRGSIVMHTLNFSPASALGLSNPQFPCTAVSTNTTNSTNVTMAVAAFAMFSDAHPHPKWVFRRSVDVVNKTITSTSFTPLLCLYNKTVFNGQINTGTIQFIAITLNTVFQGSTLSHNNTAVVLSVIEFPVLTGAVFTDYNTANSMLQTSTTATAVSGGNIVYEMAVQDAGAGVELTQHDIVISPGATMCVAVKLAGQSNYLVSSVVCFGEFS
jgi:hypothetical protein